MRSSFETSRLVLTPLLDMDAAFMIQLVNSDGWKTFIGERNINSLIQANEYIQNINLNPTTTYWVVRLKDSETPVGIVTFIKRDFLTYYDIGFALLPIYYNLGYAYESVHCLLEHLLNQTIHKKILATTIPENINSIKLLKKLGFTYIDEISNQNEKLIIYGINSI